MLKTARDNALAEGQDTRPASDSDDGVRISVGGAVARICLLVGLLVLVNVLPEGLGVTLTRTRSGQWIVRPVFEVSSAWLNLWLTSSLALWLVNLYCGRWQQATRWADLGLSVLAVFVLLQLLSGFLTQVTSIHAVPQPGDAPTSLAQIVQNPSSWSMLAAYVVLPVALLCTLWQSARKLLVMVRRKRG
jgi:hypothetical protein